MVDILCGKLRERSITYSNSGYVHALQNQIVDVKYQLKAMTAVLNALFISERKY